MSSIDDRCINNTEKPSTIGTRRGDSEPLSQGADSRISSKLGFCLFRSEGFQSTGERCKASWEKQPRWEGGPPTNEPRRHRRNSACRTLLLSPPRVFLSLAGTCGLATPRGNWSRKSDQLFCFMVIPTETLGAVFGAEAFQLVLKRYTVGTHSRSRCRSRRAASAWAWHYNVMECQNSVFSLGRFFL